MSELIRFKGKVRLLVLAMVMLGMTGTAHAEGAVSATGKGVAGGVLLGAELPMLTCAIVGVSETWPYLVFGGVGAAGGAVGGYFLETEASAAEPSLYLLAGGMALVVPTLVATLNATAYDPEVSDDLPEDAEPSTDETTPATTSARDSRSKRRRSLPLALLGVDASGLRMGVPAVQVRPSYSPRDVARFGLKQHAEVQVPLLEGSF